MAGVPALSPTWIHVAHEYPLPEAVSVKCGDYAELRRTVAAILAGTFKMPVPLQRRIDEIIDEEFCGLDGMAHRRVADAVLESLEVSQRVDRGQCLRFLYELHHGKPLSMRRISNLTRYGLSLPVSWSFRGMRKDVSRRDERGFGVDEVRDVVAAIAGVLAPEERCGVDVRRAGKDGSYITRQFEGRAVVMEAK
jgi:hypothetical protein